MSTAEVVRERFVIWSGEHRAYWRPNGQGYTTRIEGAGRFTLEDAWSRVRHCGPSKQIEIHEVDEPWRGFLRMAFPVDPPRAEP